MDARTTPHRRHFLLALASAGALTATARAQTAPAAAPPGASGGSPILFAINEGVTYHTSATSLIDRYQPIAKDLSRIVGAPVQVVSVSDYDELQRGLDERRYGLAFVHPLQHGVRAVSSGRYQLAAVARGYSGYHATFFTNADSPVKTIEDLRGRTLIAPSKESATSVLVRATLRDAKLSDSDVRISYVRYQDAVSYLVENKMIAVGATGSNAVVKAWQAKGGRVISATRPLPVKQVLVASTLPDGTTERVRDYLVGLASAADGAAKLQPLNVPGFDTFDAKGFSKDAIWIAGM